MARFMIQFEQHWIEYGTAEIEADSADAARAIAEEMASCGSDKIEWDSEHMDPQETNVGCIVRVY